jgi:membrane protease YdiL (CAAX protease family)
MTDNMQPATSQADPALEIPAPNTPYSDTARPIAPWQHTVAIIVLLGMWTVLGGHRSHAPETNPRGTVYAGGIMTSWMLFGSVVAGIYVRRSFFFDTLQRRARPWYIETARAFAVYFASLALFIVLTAILYHTRLRSSFDHSVIEAIAPRSALDLIGWLALSITAGFCEEHVFRGYLLPQVIAWLRAAGFSVLIASAIAVCATSILFGSLHLYEGLGGAILITFLGAFYALLALRFGNLRAVILAHSMLDFFIVVLLYTVHSHSH